MQLRTGTQWKALRPSGFTLIEMMIVLSIVAIFATMAAPSYKSITTSSRISAEISSLTGDLQYARSEALKEGRVVTVCASSDGVSCLGINTWQTGWIVFSDLNANGVMDSGEEILRKRESFVGGTSRDTFVASQGTAAVSFNRAGFATISTGVVTFQLHDSSNNSAFTSCLAISVTGRAALQKSGTGSCT